MPLNKINNTDFQYLLLADKIMRYGTDKGIARNGMPETKSIFGYQMRFPLQEGFPLLTTKKLSFKTIAVELLWFLKADTNIKYLVDNRCNIWNKDAYRHYKNVIEKCTEPPFSILFEDISENKLRPFTEEEFIAEIKAGRLSNYGGYKLGDLGDVYGKQWRKWEVNVFDEYNRLIGFHPIDQIKKVIEGIKKNPMGRRHIVTAWNPAEIDNMALPPCHVLFQFNCRPLTEKQRKELWAKKMGREFQSEYDSVSRSKEHWDDYFDTVMRADGIPKYYLDCALTQRSCDTFLGVPFNIASYALLTELVAAMCGMVAGDFVWTGNDVHIYNNHFEPVNEQMKRPCDKPMPKLSIAPHVSRLSDISEVMIDDLSLTGYDPYPEIKGELSVGL